MADHQNPKTCPLPIDSETGSAFRSVCDHIATPLWVCDPSGRITSVNTAGQAFSGLSPIEHFGFQWFSLIYVDDQGQAALAWEDAVHLQQALTLEFRVRHKSGALLWMRATLQPHFDKSGALQCYVGTGIDITKQKQAEATVSATDIRLRAYFSQGRTILWRTDPDGVITHSRLDLDPEDKTTLDIGPELSETLIHPADLVTVQRARDRALLHGIPYSVEMRLRTSDGSYRWYQCRAVPVRNPDGVIDEWIGSTEDIHARRTAADNLVRSHERFLAIYNSTASGIIHKDQNGQITNANASAGQILQCAPEDLVGKSLHEAGWDWLLPNLKVDRNALQTLAAQSATTEVPITDVLQIRRRADGRHLWLECTAFPPQRDEHGRVLGTFAIFRDITDSHSAQDTLQRLAASRDHRSRNLLANIRAMIRLSRAPDVSSLKTSLEGRVDAIARAYDILSVGGWTGADVASLIADELAPFEPDSDINPRSPSSAGNTTISLSGRTVKLQPTAVQPLAVVIHELATNAAHHGCLSRPGGRLTVDWCTNEENLEITWTETTPFPLDVHHHRAGFGSKLINTSIKQQLSGLIGYDWRRDGLTARIQIPLRKVEPAAPRTRAPEYQPVALLLKASPLEPGTSAPDAAKVP